MTVGHFIILVLMYVWTRFALNDTWSVWIDESWMMLFEHLGFQPKGTCVL